MKIVYLSSLYPPYVGGGAEITLSTLAESMQAAGHQVTVLTTGPEAARVEQDVNGVRVIRVGLHNVYWHHRREKAESWQRFLWHLRDINNLAMAKTAEEIVREERPDLVSCHNLAGWSASVWKGIERTGTPVVQVLHDLYNLCPNSNMFRGGRECASRCLRCSMFRAFHPRMSDRVDAVVGISRFVLDRHLKYGHFGKAKIRSVIHNARLMRVLPHTRSPSDDKIRFGFIGTLTPAKGIEFLLKVFSELSLPGAQLVVAGRGDPQYERALQAFASHTISFVGYVEPRDFYAGIDVLVVPSLWEEALGMVVPEAFAHGVPVLGSRRGGIPEMIDDGKNGFLFEPNRPQELVALIQRFAANPREIAGMSAGANESALAYTNIPSWTSKYTALYSRLLQGDSVSSLG